MKNKAAFFDIDGTFYRDSLLIEHYKKLIKYDIIDPIIWHKHVKYTFKDWDKRQGDYETYLREVCDVYTDTLKGIGRESIEFIAQQVIRLKGDRVYKYTKERIEYHQREGHKVIFISGSPDFLVSKMADKYNATDFVGTKYHFDENNCFNGETTPMFDSRSKNHAIDVFRDKYDIDLDNSYAYGDTNGDISMFQRVGNAFAINPAKELITNITANEELLKKTKVVIERKDVIYQIDLATNTVTF